MSETIVPESPWRVGLRGARANIIPGLFLQAFALALVLAYFFDAPTRSTFDRLAVFREKSGISYSIVATSLFGGVIPFLYLRLNAATRRTHPWNQFWFYALFWAYKGVEVDLFYRFQSVLFGTGVEVRTVFFKMVFDMFIYGPIWAVPETVIPYHWKDSGFSLRAVIADIRRGGYYKRKILPTLISNWGVWIPAVCLIYSLPTGLQLPLFNIVLCFFSLLLSHITAHGREKEKQLSAHPA